MSERLEQRLREALPRIADGAPGQVPVPAAAARRSAVARRRAGRWAVAVVPVAAAALVAGTVWLAQPHRAASSPPAVTTSGRVACPEGWRPSAARTRVYSMRAQLGPDAAAIAEATFRWEHPVVAAAYVVEGSDVRVRVDGREVAVIHLVRPGVAAGMSPDTWEADSVTPTCDEQRDLTALVRAGRCPDARGRALRSLGQIYGVQRRGYPTPDAAVDAWIASDPATGDRWERDELQHDSYGNARYYDTHLRGVTGPGSHGAIARVVVRRLGEADWRVQAVDQSCVARTGNS